MDLRRKEAAKLPERDGEPQHESAAASSQELETGHERTSVDEERAACSRDIVQPESLSSRHRALEKTIASKHELRRRHEPRSDNIAGADYAREEDFITRSRNASYHDPVIFPVTERQPPYQIRSTFSAAKIYGHESETRPARINRHGVEMDVEEYENPVRLVLDRSENHKSVRGDSSSKDGRTLQEKAESGGDDSDSYSDYLIGHFRGWEPGLSMRSTHGGAPPRRYAFRE